MRLRNFILNQIEKSQKKIKLNSYPISLNLETTNRCNVKCIMCLRNLNPPSNSEISKDLLGQVVKLFPYLYQIRPFLLGEPLIYTDFVNLMNSINKKTEICITTSLQLLGDKHINALKGKRGVINVSLDAASDSMYELIRCGDLNQVKNNILRIKKETKLDLLLCMVVFKLNFKEVEDFLKLAETLGALTVFFWKLMPGCDFIVRRGNIVFDYKENHLSSNELNTLKEITLKRKYPFRIIDYNNKNVILPHFYYGKQLLRKIVRRHFSEILRKMAEVLNKHRFICTRPWERLTISCQGDVGVCCHQETILGNLNQKPLLEIWNSKQMLKIREDIVKGNIPEGCKGCNLLREKKLWWA